MFRQEKYKSECAFRQAHTMANKPFNSTNLFARLHLLRESQLTASNVVSHFVSRAQSGLEAVLQTCFLQEETKSSTNEERPSIQPIKFFESPKLQSKRTHSCKNDSEFFFQLSHQLHKNGRTKKTRLIKKQFETRTGNERGFRTRELLNFSCLQVRGRRSEDYK